MTRLTSRVEALEQGGDLAPVFVVSERDESEETAIARYEASHGPIGCREVVVVVTGVPRAQTSWK